MDKSKKIKLGSSSRHTLRSLFHNLGIYQKLLITFILLSMLPTLLLGLFYYSFSYSKIITQKTSQSHNALKSICESVTQSLYKETDIRLIRISLNEAVRNLMMSNIDNTNLRIYQDKLVAIKKLFFENTSRRYIDYICLLSKKQYPLTSSPSIDGSTEKIINDPDFQKFQSSSTNFWRGSIVKINGCAYKILARKIYSPTGNDVAGYVFMWINEKGIEEVLDRYSNEISGTLFILNPDGTVFSSNSAQLSSGKSIYDLYPDLELDEDQTPQRLKSISQEHLVCTYIDKYDHIYAINDISLDDLVNDTDKILAITVIIMLTLLLICFFAAALLSRYFTIPILKLAKIMTASDIGQVRTDFVPKYNDEVGYLARCFNEMAEKLNHQAVVIEQTQKKQREAELKAFESQIKPHFLYNTLSTVIWLIGANQPQSAIKVTSALSKLFRISISRGNNIIPIEKEVEHVRSYLEIQQVRYENEFICSFDIDDETLAHDTVKMVLQPLVENSIYHAMHYKENGHIIISCKNHGNFNIMSVMDNGGLMDSEKCGLINATLEKMQPSAHIELGVGIKNVHDRIRYTFGSESGLCYRIENEWTIAEIKIPAHRSDNKC